MQGVVMITGAHGVGRTTVLEAVSSEVGISTYTAGDLIRRRMSHVEPTPSKTVPNRDSNQEFLISEVDALLEAENVFLLDGHVVLLSPTGRYEPIPAVYFARLGVVGFIHLDSDPRRVQSNLQRRGDSHISLQSIDENLRMERLYSPYLASYLNVPHIRLKLGESITDTVSVAEAVKMIVEGR